MSDFRPRSNSEILDAAVEIYRRHFVVFAAINVFVAIPWAISTYIGQTAILSQQPDGLLTSVLVRFAGGFISPFTEGAMTCVASAAYLGMPVDMGQAVRTAFRHPGRLFFAMFAKWALIIFGLILFIVPGAVAFKRYFAIPMTVLLEDNTAGRAMARSRELSNGSGKRIFGLLGGVFVFMIIVSSIVAQIIGSFSGGAIAAGIGSLVAGATIAPFGTVVVTLLYYDIRIRREGYDIELMALALEANPPVSNPVS